MNCMHCIRTGEIPIDFQLSFFELNANQLQYRSMSLETEEPNWPRRCSERIQVCVRVCNCFTYPTAVWFRHPSHMCGRYRKNDPALHQNNMSSHSFLVRARTLMSFCERPPPYNDDETQCTNVIICITDYELAKVTSSRVLHNMAFSVQTPSASCSQRSVYRVHCAPSSLGSWKHACSRLWYAYETINKIYRKLWLPTVWCFNAHIK